MPAVETGKPVRGYRKARLTEMDDLIAKSRDGGTSEDARKAARERLAESTFKYAIHFANKWAKPLGGLDEAASLASVAWLKAVSRYQPARSLGGGFLAYLKKCVWCEARDEVRYLRRAFRTPEASGGCVVSMTGLEFMVAAKSEQPVPNEALIEDTLAVLDRWKALGGRYARMAEVVSGRFGLGGGKPVLLKEFSASMGVTRERVRQIEMDAIDLLGVELRRHNNLKALVA